jgi:hypothetical protein
MDAAEFVEVGGKIVTIGGQLEKLRTEREALDVQITALEKELFPLLGRHAELVSSLMGPVVSKPLPPPVVLQPPLPPDMIGGDDKVALARRIKGFLNNAEPGTSATQIAEALKVDASLVREVMRSL